MSKKTLIVVGNGMVGHHFLEQLVASPAAAEYDILVFGEEKQLAYDRVHLSEYFAGPPTPISPWALQTGTPNRASSCC
jgi:nitrite reductase (NADH) large subunit